MSEMWKPVTGYEGLYEVSSLGNIRSARRKGAPGGILKPVKRPDGRLRVALSKSGKVKDFLVHRLVLTAFRGDCPEGMEALHADDIPTNNRLENLRWGTHAENVQDKIRNGRTPRGVFWNGETCRSGRHPWNDETKRATSKGFICVLCRRESSRRSRTQGLPADAPGHGTSFGWSRGCQCPPCVESRRAYQRETEKNRTRRKKGRNK